MQESGSVEDMRELGLLFQIKDSTKISKQCTEGKSRNKMCVTPPL